MDVKIAVAVVIFHRKHVIIYTINGFRAAADRHRDERASEPFGILKTGLPARARVRKKNLRKKKKTRVVNHFDRNFGRGFRRLIVIRHAGNTAGSPATVGMAIAAIDHGRACRQVKDKYPSRR